VCSVQRSGSTHRNSSTAADAVPTAHSTPTGSCITCTRTPRARTHTHGTVITATPWMFYTYRNIPYIPRYKNHTDTLRQIRRHILLRTLGIHRYSVQYGTAECTLKLNTLKQNKSIYILCDPRVGPRATWPSR